MVNPHYGAGYRVAPPAPKNLRYWQKPGRVKNNNQLWLGKATALGAAAVMGYYGNQAFSSTASAGSKGGFWGKLWGAGKDAIIGGVRSGLSKRIDAQIAGRKAAQFGGTAAGGLQMADQAYSGEAMAAQASQQAESQGQYLGFLDEQNRRSQALDLYKFEREMALSWYALSNSGDPANGQRGPAPDYAGPGSGSEIPSTYVPLKEIEMTPTQRRFYPGNVKGSRHMQWADKRLSMRDRW